MELIPPNTIHLVNLNHYLEDSPFAQYLLEHNKQMEPNMNFKIWTENDALVKNYNGFFNTNDNGTKSASITMAAIYLYGGTYCELDFEYVHKDFYYNLYNNEPDIIYNVDGEPLCRLWDNCVYFFKKKNKIAKLSAELLHYFNDNNDVAAVSDKKSLRLISEEKLIEMKKKVKKLHIININHYKGLRKNIKFCKFDSCLNVNYWEEKVKFYVLKENYHYNCIDGFGYSYEIITNKERLREIYNLLSKFPQFEIEVLDDCLD
jgi:hypothetical protein